MNYRKERIERLLSELQYEITRGILEREISEQLAFTFIIPVSNTYKNGVVYSRLEVFPVEQSGLLGIPPQSRRLKIVRGADDDSVA